MMVSSDFIPFLLVLSACGLGASSAFLTTTPPNNPAAVLLSSSPLSFSSALRSTTYSSPTDDPYATLIDAISHAADAAHSAAYHSEQLSSTIFLPVHPQNSEQQLMFASSSVLSSSTQAGLSTLENNIISSSDPSVMMQAIYDALDSSIHAAEMAASSTSVLVHNLAHFDEALSTSMALAANNQNFHNTANMMLLSPDYADVAQAKLALLLHNLSGGLTIENNFLTNFLSEVDKQLDALLLTPTTTSTSSAILSSTSTSNLILFGTMAAVLAYTQRQAGIDEYKMELRRLMERGEFDMTMLAQDVGLRVDTTVEASHEDPVHAMEMAMESAAEDIVAVDETPVSVEQRVEVVATLTPKPPAADVPLDTLMKAAATATTEYIASQPVAAAAPLSIKPSKIKAVNVQKKKGPMASPLARLFAEELGIDLDNLGRGSGKDGKILIDDVRNFQSRLEAAKKSMTSNRGLAYFATAST